MKKRVLSLALCLVLVVGLFSGLTMSASAGIIDKDGIIKRLIQEKVDQIKEEFEIPDLDTDAIVSSFTAAATSGDFGENNCLHWEVTTGTPSGKTLTISGNGAMPDFDFPNGNLAPWWNYEALGMLTSFGNLKPKFDLEGNLKKVIIKDGVTNVSDYALFLLPVAEQVTLPDSVTSIGRYGIAMCSKLTGLSIPKTVTEIGDFGLAGNGFTTAVTLPDGLQSLGRGAFDACASLSRMTLPAAITAVPDKAFAGCTKLLSVRYDGAVTAIGASAFARCKSLTAAPIPETVTDIGASAFSGCTALKDVRCYGAAPTVEPGNSEAHSFEPDIVTIHYNPDPDYGWTLDADGKWQGYTVSGKGACLHTGYGTHENTVPPTCGEDGRIETICSNCGEVTATKEIPATGAHTWDNGTVTTEPTENEPGVRTYTCTVCGEVKTEVIPATGAHTHKWDAGKVTTEPTATTPGVRTYTCTICGLTKTEVIPATGGSTVCPGGTSCPSYGFTDVAGPSDWSHEGIDYCVRRSLMVGTYAGMFSPNMACSRAQIVQILYNLSGDKTDYSNYYLPFTDVSTGDWFYDAVVWAYANDIVAGTDTTTFAPNRDITREQMAVILYGYTAKYASAFTGGGTSLSQFPDAGSVANWAYAAMNWAVGNGLISGMESGGVSYLAPQGSATRAQASAIIMRYCQLIGQ